jgi:hypothetical protein
LRFEINEKDDKIVKGLKEEVNKKEITFKDISNVGERLGEVGYDYNLVYSLKTRHSIQYSSLVKWSNILNMNIEVNFVPKNRI